MSGNQGLFFPSAGKGTLDTPTGGTGLGNYAPPVTGANVQKSKNSQSSSQSFDRPDYNTTQVITNNVYQSLMGRNATQAEIQKAHDAYTQYALTHPISSSSSFNNGTTNTLTSNATSSNISESNFIQSLVDGSAESKAYTSATTYMDAIQSYINKSRGLY